MKEGWRAEIIGICITHDAAQVDGVRGRHDPRRSPLAVDVARAPRHAQRHVGPVEGVTPRAIHAAPRAQLPEHLDGRLPGTRPGRRRRYLVVGRREHVDDDRLGEAPVDLDLIPLASGARGEERPDRAARCASRTRPGWRADRRPEVRLEVADLRQRRRLSLDLAQTWPIKSLSQRSRSAPPWGADDIHEARELQVARAAPGADVPLDPEAHRGCSTWSAAPGPERLRLPRLAPGAAGTADKRTGMISSSFAAAQDVSRDQDGLVQELPLGGVVPSPRGPPPRSPRQRPPPP